VGPECCRQKARTTEGHGPRAAKQKPCPYAGGDARVRQPVAAGQAHQLLVAQPAPALEHHPVVGMAYHHELVLNHRVGDRTRGREHDQQRDKDALMATH
jgi:hypothetical protein